MSSFPEVNVLTSAFFCASYTSRELAYIFSPSAPYTLHIALDSLSGLVSVAELVLLEALALLEVLDLVVVVVLDVHIMTFLVSSNRLASYLLYFYFWIKHKIVIYFVQGKRVRIT